jgi:hypothetical protein
MLSEPFSAAFTPGSYGYRRSSTATSPEYSDHELCSAPLSLHGLQKIIEAVKLAVDFLSGVTTFEEVCPDSSAGLIGVSHPRPNALALAAEGEIRRDMKMEGVLKLAAIRVHLTHLPNR